MNNVSFVGRVVDDPKIWKTEGKTPFSVFRLAVSLDRKVPEGEPDSIFLNVKVFGKAVDYIETRMQKGSVVSVTGSLGVDRYEKDGVKREYPEVNADRVSVLAGSKPREDAAESPESAVGSAPSSPPTGLF